MKMQEKTCFISILLKVFWCLLLLRIFNPCSEVAQTINFLSWIAHESEEIFKFPEIPRKISEI